MEEDKSNIEDLKKETAERILYLIRLGHPPEKGEKYTRYEVQDEIKRRGLQLLKDLNWNCDLNSIYKNRYTGSEESLGQLLNYYQGFVITNGTENNCSQLFSVLEHYYPIDKFEDKNLMKEYNPKNKNKLSAYF